MSQPTIEKPDTRTLVREAYGRIAREGSSCCGEGGCGGGDVDVRMQAIGYTVEELNSLPEGANMGLACGNPTAIAELAEGEVVVDLGSGGGFDAFLAGPKVGANGRVIGVDMTADMIAKARNSAAQYRDRTGLDNVEFRLGEIEHLPVADASVDVVISNCVINLSPDKAQVWKEIGRILKPGGRVAVSDIAWLKPIPVEVQNMVEALVGCIAGAVLIDETEAMAREAGLSDIRLTPRTEYVNNVSEAREPLFSDIRKHLPDGESLADYVASVEVRATRPVR